MLEAVTEATQPLDELFGDLIDYLITNKSYNPVLEREAERIISTVCQRSLLNPEVINKVKTQYGEGYFSLMGIGYADYFRVESLV